MSLNAYQRTLKTPKIRVTPNTACLRKSPAICWRRNSAALVDAKLVEAIDRNRKLWIALATDCADDNNQLPKETRAAIISLSIWVHKYSREVTRKGEDIGALD